MLLDAIDFKPHEFMSKSDTAFQRNGCLSPPAKQGARLGRFGL